MRLKTAKRALAVLISLAWLTSGVAGAAPPGTPELIPNDPGYPAGAPALKQIDVPAAWRATTGSPSIIIAVVDSGVTPTADLAPNLLPGWNVAVNNGDVSDQNGHGTSVASIAGARLNDDVGVAGVCGGCRILPVKVTTCAETKGCSNESLEAQGVRWAAEHGARVINFSQGESADGPAAPTLAAAVADAVSRGIVVVMGAGNWGRGDPNANHFASDSPTAIRVAGTTLGGQLDSHSNYGSSWVEVAASYSAAAEVPAGYTGLFAGTSASAPLVSGVVGLMLSYNPSLSPADVKRILMDTCTKTGIDVACGGTVNALSALEALGYKPPPPVSLTLRTAGTGSGVIVGPPGCVESPCAVSQGDEIKLSAVPDDDSTFGGWQGVEGCTKGADCALKPVTDTTVTAIFNKRRVVLKVVKSGAGLVTSLPAGVVCGARCLARFDMGTAVMLRAKPAKGFVISKWTGCVPVGRLKLSCGTPKLAKASVVRVVFVKKK